MMGWDTRKSAVILLGWLVGEHVLIDKGLGRSQAERRLHIGQRACFVDEGLGHQRIENDAAKAARSTSMFL